MVFPFFRRKGHKQEHFSLSENFRLMEREHPPYDVPLDGLELRDNKIDLLLEEFVQQKHPLLHMYVPHESEDHLYDFQLSRIERKTIVLASLSMHEEAFAFLRNYSPVRFAFEHEYYTYRLEIDVLGILDEEGTFLAEKPDRIYMDRRSHKRYQLWPVHKAYFNGMQVQDLSQQGVRARSQERLSSETIENAYLELPAVYNPETEECLYHGSQVEVPKAVLKTHFKHGEHYYNGFYFDQEWEDEKKKKLNDFLLAVRKYNFYS